MATTNALQVFNHEAFGTIRTTTDENGQILFGGKDVATALGYSNTKDALGRHCKGVVKRYPLETPGGIQQIRFITEADLYRLIVSSHLAAAERFEAWVMEEVLPSIRRHGIYAVDSLLDNDDFLQAAIEHLRAERMARLAAEQALAEAAPKASYYDVVLASPSLVTMTAIAKDYGLSAKKLNALLAQAKVQFKQSGQWFLYAHHANKGYTQSKTFTLPDGQVRMHTQWTQAGRLFIYDLLKNRFGILPVVEQAHAAIESEDDK
ncbi:phage antirepressor [Schaalia sp. lx-260]|uniref:phage antirepressor n=1 Tax=Schaalia sp. lx-260 TaxID=2899082 RepID=UPI001E4FFF70|nr:phage antirepressor KilAC domain-containing protein [Schaalia sp. lx-260]MCD4549146.1 phage antirepressor KilAC domain-containing protein [Schaalia sp. lx-260]